MRATTADGVIAGRDAPGRACGVGQVPGLRSRALITVSDRELDVRTGARLHGFRIRVASLFIPAGVSHRLTRSSVRSQ
jgi:hypothetical protein